MTRNMTPQPDHRKQKPVFAVLAGQGRLPFLVAETLSSQNHEPLLIAFKDQTAPATVRGRRHVWVRLGQVGRVLNTLEAHHVSHVILAGGIVRPSLRSLRPDWQGFKLLSRVLVGAKGDNDLLTRVMAFLEKRGYTIVAAHDVLPNLLAFSGLLNSVSCSADDQKDLLHGFMVAKALGAQDIGQAVIVQEGIVLAVEAAEGTDALLERCDATRARLHGLRSPGGVLVKVSKPGQDLRADLPTIGVQTVLNAAQAGLRGIGLESGKTLMIDPEEVKRVADESGLFLIGLGYDVNSTLFLADDQESQK